MLRQSSLAVVMLMAAAPTSSVNFVGVPLTSQVTVLASSDNPNAVCSDSMCYSQCRAWIDNPFCIVWDSHCLSNDSCYCQSLCAFKGAKPHLALTDTSCADRVDACWPN